MTRPIKETPILLGKDAEVFSKKIKENETTKAPKEEYDRIMTNYNYLKGTHKKMKIEIKKEDKGVQLLKDAREALIWCSGSNDFAPEGMARDGWVKGPQKVILEILDYLVGNKKIDSA